MKKENPEFHIPSMDKHPEKGLQIPVSELRFTLEDQPRWCSLSSEDTGEGFLIRRSWLRENHKPADKERVWLVPLDKEQNMPNEINIASIPRLVRREIQWRIRLLLAPHNIATSESKYTQGITAWKQATSNTSDPNLFDKFSIEIFMDEEGRSGRLRLQFVGKSLIERTSWQNVMTGDMVMVDGKVMPYSTFMYLPDEVGRVVKSGDKFRQNKKPNPKKLDEVWAKTEKFLREDLRPLLKQIPNITFEEDWEKRELYKIRSITSVDLKFGENRTSNDPLSGLKNYGAAVSPPYPIVRFFVIQVAGSEALSNELSRILADQLPVYIKKPRVVYSSAENLWIDPGKQGWKERLHQHFSKLASAVTHEAYYGFYLSPWGRYDSSHQHYYYQLKSAAIKYGISLQVIEKNKFTLATQQGNFRYFIPNLAVSTIAKLGGVPWKVAVNNNKKILICGYASYRPHHGQAVMAANVFMDTSGTFLDAQAWPVDQYYRLDGYLANSIRLFREKKGNPELILLYYYKPFGKKDEREVRDFFEDPQNKGIPMIVIQINVSGSVPVIAFPPPDIHADGCYVPLGENRYLLFTQCNSKFRRLPLMMRIYANRVNFLNNEWVEDIMELTYKFTYLNFRSILPSSLPAMLQLPRLLAMMRPYIDILELPEEMRGREWFV